MRFKDMISYSLLGLATLSLTLYTGYGNKVTEELPVAGSVIQGEQSKSPETFYGKTNFAGKSSDSFHKRLPQMVEKLLHNGAPDTVNLAMVSARRTFVRMENNAPVRFSVTNLQNEPLKGATVCVTLSGIPQIMKELPEISGGDSAEVSFNFDTSLRPDDYTLMATVNIPGDNPYSFTSQFKITIVPRKTPNLMPVVMWGSAQNDEQIDWLQKIGFTHLIGLPCDYSRIWEAGGHAEPADPETITERKKNLDKLLRCGMRVVASLSPGRWARSQEEFRQINRKGNSYDDEDVCGLFERVQQFCHDVRASLSKAYGDHPGFGTALVHTEVRGHSRTYFNDHDWQAFCKFAVYDIPEQVRDIRGIQVLIQ